MGRLKGYVQRSLSFRPPLYRKLSERAKKDGVTNYDIVEAAMGAALRNGQVRKKIRDAVQGRTASIAKDYKYVPVYVKEEGYLVIKATAVMTKIPLYILMEEIIVRYLLQPSAYRRYVEKHFAEGA